MLNINCLNGIFAWNYYMALFITLVY